MNARVGIACYWAGIWIDEEQVGWTVLFGFVWWLAVLDYDLGGILTLLEKAWSTTK